MALALSMFLRLLALELMESMVWVDCSWGRRKLQWVKEIELSLFWEQSKFALASFTSNKLAKSKRIDIAMLSSGCSLHPPSTSEFSEFAPCSFLTNLVGSSQDRCNARSQHRSNKQPKKLVAVQRFRAERH
jgi:hypothetical protein